MPTKAKRTATPEPQDEIGALEEQTLHELVGLLPSKGAFIKVYQLFPLPPAYQGTPPRKWTFDNVEALAGVDLEEEIHRIGQDKGWESGKYRVVAYRMTERNGARIAWKRELAFDFEPKSPGSAVPNSALSAGLGVMESVAGILEKLGVKADKGNDVATLGQLLLTGVTTGAQSSKAQVEGAAALNAMMAGMMKANSDSSTAMLALVKEMMSDPKGRGDFLDQLEKARKVGLLPGPVEGGEPEDLQAESENPLDQLSRALDLVEKVKGLYPPPPQVAPGTKIGFGQALLQTLGPALIGVANKWADAFREYMVTQRTAQIIAAQARGASPPALGAPTPAETPPPSGPPAAPRPVLAGTTTSLLARAIREQDGGFYGTLETVLATGGAQPLLDAIMRGEIAAEDAWGYAQQSGLPELTLPGAQEFFLGFVAWLKSRAPAAPTAPVPPVTATPSSRVPGPTQNGSDEEEADDAPLYPVVCDRCGNVVAEVASAEEFAELPPACPVKHPGPDGHPPVVCGGPLHVREEEP